MAIIFETRLAQRRAAAAREGALLTGPAVVGVLLVSFVVAASSWLGWLTIVPSAGVLGVALLTSGVAGLLGSVFIFGATYFPYQTPRPTLLSLREAHERGEVINSAATADLGLLTALGPSLRKKGDVRLGAVLERLLGTPAARKMLARLEIPVEQVRSTVGTLVVPALTWEQFATDFTSIAWEQRAVTIVTEHLVGALLLQPMLRNFLREKALQEKDIRFVTWWLTTQQATQQEARRWWERARLLGFTGVGLAWTSGYTPLLDQFARFPAGNLWDQIIFGREAHVEAVITTLARARQSNVLLVGQPGTGRLGVVQEVARRVQRNNAHPALRGQRVVYLHIGEVLARADSGAGQLAVVGRVLHEMERAGNIIAVIDGLGSILGREGETRLNLSDVLLPFFSSLAVRVVVIISSEEYHLRLKANQELAHFFEVVSIEQVSAEATLQVLAFTIPALELTTGLTFPYTTLRTIVEETEGILPHIPFPERAFDILEEVVVVAQQQGERVVPAVRVERLISQKVGIPVGRVRDEERAHLLDLENLMHQRVVNQHRAVTALARAMIRARAGVRERARPIGTFLFLGPTGVGKTETAKTLAHAYFGSENFLQRLDMSEFQTAESSERLIGSGRQPVGRLTALIADHPFCVLLLDEFEKAHPSIHQLFLQVFDEGRLTDARGQTVSFRHAIMVATSNAGAEFIRQAVDHGPLPAEFDEMLSEHILREGIFRPELLNRFDGVITFTPLTPEHIREVAKLMLTKLNQRLDATHGITVAVTPELIEYVVGIGYHPEFGARPLARAIADSVEYAVAQRLLTGTVTAGQRVVLSPENLESLQVR